MPFRVGVLESRSLVQPPGSCLFDPPEEDASALGTEVARLKRDRKRPEIILQPQPSNDGRDPLNFARWRRESLFLVLMIGSILTGVIGPIFVPAFGVMAQELGVPVAKIANLNGILLVGEGVASMLFIISSKLFGRRHTYLACSLLSTAFCFVAALAKGYELLYAARFFQGAGMSAYAVLLGSTITDVFFVHEHGVRIAFWQVTYCASVNLAPIFSSMIVERWNWQACFYTLGAFEALVLVGVFFVCPETLYDRQPTSEVIEEEEKYSTEHVEKVGAVLDSKAGACTPSCTEGQGLQAHHVQDTLTFRQSLKLFTRVPHQDRLWLQISRPFAVFFAPHIFYATLAYTISFSWFVLTGATYAQIYSGMYYTESLTTVGILAGVAPMIGTIVACLISGPLTDYSARWLSVRNNGIFEPEFRLVVLVPASICIAIGGFGWGWTIGGGYSAIVSTSIAGFAFAGCTLGICAVVGYANASFPKQGGDTFSVMMLTSRFAIFGMLYIVNEWLAIHGAKNFLGWLTGASLILYALGLPVYIFGKRIRSWTAESTVLGWCCS